MVEEKTIAVPGEGIPTQASRPANSPRLRRSLWRYGPPTVWVGLIFLGSTDLLSASNTGSVLMWPLTWLFPHASEATVRTLHLIMRKGAHFTEYAILAWLVARALRTSSRELLRSRWFWLSLLLVIAYALSDEFHQSFVATRTGSIYDSMIDSLGGLVALLVYRTRRPQSG
jgi:VanZ family protein